MGTPLGPKYISYTYMDPLGFIFFCFCRVLGWLLATAPDASEDGSWGRGPYEYSSRGVAKTTRPIHRFQFSKPPVAKPLGF